MPAGLKTSAQNTFHNLSKTILKKVEDVDVVSLISTINLLAKGSIGMPIDVIKPDKGKLFAVEQQIISQFDLYIERDISVVISSLMKLEHTPKDLLKKLNKMNKMSTFNKDQCVRMLEALVENVDAPSTVENDALKMELFDKFFDQLETHSLKLNSYNLCRALSCIEALVKSEKVMTKMNELVSLQRKTELLVGRLTDMLSRDADVAVLDLYWSNKFVHTVEKIFVAQIGNMSGYKPLDLR